MSQQRRYRVNGRLYVVRDVGIAGRFLGCEYAQRNPNGSTRWVQCREGVAFSEIKPLRARSTS